MDEYEMTIFTKN